MTKTITASAGAQRPKKARIFPAILFLLGLTLTVGGGWLAGLGGSLYYLVTGVALVFSAVLVWRGHALGGWLYALILAWTLAWAVREAGVDFWTLLPRLAVLFVLGLWLVTPGYRRTVVRGPIDLELGKTTLTAFLAAFIVLVAAGRLIGDPHEIRSHGPLPGVMQAYPLKAPEGDWHHVGNGPGGLRYSELARLTPINVDKLELAWTYRGEETSPATGQATDGVPLKVADSLYFCTASGDIVALDAETGEQRWRHAGGAAPAGQAGANACRGVAYHRLPADEAAPPAAVAGALASPSSAASSASPVTPVTPVTQMTPGEPTAGAVAEAPALCRQRIFGATAGRQLVALDARSGEPAEGEHYERGLPRARAPLSADEDLGLVFVVTGQAGSLGEEGQPVPSSAAFASSILALEVDTGRLVWQFRTPADDAVHDDLASQPTLIELQVRGDFVPALLQSTRRGQHYLLDRRTGVSVFDVQPAEVAEHGDELTTMASTPTPASASASTSTSASSSTSTSASARPRPEGELDAPGGVAGNVAGVGGFDAAAAPVHQTAEQDMWGLTLVDQLWCRIQFRQARSGATRDAVGADALRVAAPVSLGSALAGGATWTAASFDPERRVMVGNWNRLPGGEGSDGSDSAAGPRWVSPLGSSCIAPPHTLVTAVDLNTHQVLWERRAEVAVEPSITTLASRLAGPPQPSVPGGSVTTRGGLVFVADPAEQSLRALDLRNGDLLWQEPLAVSGPMTPMTYLSRDSDRQFVLVAGQSAAAGSGYLAAYALPRQGPAVE